MEKVGMLVLLSGVLSASELPPTQGGALSVRSLNRFLSQCVDLALTTDTGLRCQGLQCQGEAGLRLSLEELQSQECVEDRDCMSEHTGMHCLRGRCDCPPYTGLNLTSCMCQQTSLCSTYAAVQLQDTAVTRCMEHNGRRCDDSYCSCHSSPNFTSVLLDPTSLFCVLPAAPEELALGGGATSIGLAVLGALIGFVAVVLVAIFIVTTYKNCVCERGDYKCDAPDGDVPEHHIAAWDHPSMDYVSKDDENIIFTLCQASDSVRMSNASTIYVQDDETVMANGSAVTKPGPGAEHENMAYVEEEEPRND